MCKAGRTQNSCMDQHRMPSNTAVYLHKVPEVCVELGLEADGARDVARVDVPELEHRRLVDRRDKVQRRVVGEPVHGLGVYCDLKRTNASPAQPSPAQRRQRHLATTDRLGHSQTGQPVTRTPRATEQAGAPRLI
jgi:hypothetical protein